MTFENINLTINRRRAQSFLMNCIFDCNQYFELCCNHVIALCHCVINFACATNNSLLIPRLTHKHPECHQQAAGCQLLQQISFMHRHTHTHTTKQKPTHHLPPLCLSSKSQLSTKHTEDLQTIPLDRPEEELSHTVTYAHTAHTPLHPDQMEPGGWSPGKLLIFH